MKMIFQTGFEDVGGGGWWGQLFSVATTDVLYSLICFSVKARSIQPADSNDLLGVCIV